MYLFDQSPLPIFRIVNVQLFDQFGNPYPFNGLEHQFTLEIVSYYDRVMGADIGSHRGISDHRGVDSVWHGRMT